MINLIYSLYIYLEERADIRACSKSLIFLLTTNLIIKGIIKQTLNINKLMLLLRLQNDGGIRQNISLN